MLLSVTGAFEQARADEYDVVARIPLTGSFSLVERKFNREQNINPVTAQKISFLKTTLQILERRIPNFVRRLSKKGYGDVYLSKGDTLALAYVRPSEKSINLTESVFEKKPYDIGPFGEFTPEQVAIFHELAHAFDEDELSFSSEVLKLMGWTDEFTINVSGVRRYSGRILNVDPAEFTSQKAYQSALLRNGDSFYDQLRESAMADKRFANARGYPSLYAMTGADPSGAPRECFAEFAAFIFADPDAGIYLRPDQIAWFRDNVLN